MTGRPGRGQLEGAPEGLLPPVGLLQEGALRPDLLPPVGDFAGGRSPHSGSPGDLVPPPGSLSLHSVRAPARGHPAPGTPAQGTDLAPGRQCGGSAVARADASSLERERGEVVPLAVG